MIVYWMKGLPASGKSSLAAEMLKDPDLQPIKRLNRDSMREMLDGGKWTRENEQVIISVETSLILGFLEDGFNVIVDDTNLSSSATKIMNQIKAKFPDVEHKTIDLTSVPVEECIRRDSLRANSVGAKVIRQMHRRYLADFPKNTLGPMVYGDHLPMCVIFDVDGTLAHMGDRGPFEWNKVSTDIPNDSITALACYLSEEMDVIVLSGRDEVCRKDTEEWLKRHISFDKLYMRPQGDMRDDTIVKKELYDRYIKDKYNVLLVVDDRDKVVDQWRTMGLTCLQCNYGDF